MLVSLKDLLDEAKEQKRAVGAFNCYNYETLRGTLEAAEELGQSVIIAFGENYMVNMEISEVYALVSEMGRKSHVKVALHLDHCKSVDHIEAAIEAGFTSVMYDGSHLSLEENIANTRRVVAMAHQAGVSVEAELGCLELGAFSNEEGASAVYTDPDQARRFVLETDVDALAVSVGTVHGMYRGEPKVNLDVLRAINDSVDKPLVLHGGSGTPPHIIKEAINSGIAKINVNTEISVYAMEEIKKSLAMESPLHFSALSINSRKAVRSVVSRYIELFSNL